MGGGLLCVRSAWFGLVRRGRCPLSGSASPNADTFAEAMPSPWSCKSSRVNHLGQVEFGYVVA